MSAYARDASYSEPGNIQGYEEGRGVNIDEDELADAIEDGTAAGPGLDVYHDERVFFLVIF